MSSDSASNRQQEWELVVRRSFEISDFVALDEARETLISCFERHLEANGWQGAPRAIAQPIVDSLMLLEVAGGLSDPTFATRDGAHRILAHGISVVDPERLVYDARFEYPPEIVATTQQMLVQIVRYARQERFSD